MPNHTHLGRGGVLPSFENNTGVRKVARFQQNLGVVTGADLEFSKGGGSFYRCDYLLAGHAQLYPLSIVFLIRGGGRD